jgi:ABC-type amino acid transport substrate-binding protein
MKPAPLYKRIYLLFLILVTTGCDNFPKDPDQTLSKIKNGRLLVGYTENPPWVVKQTGEPTGIEADLIRKFAQSQSASVVWVNDAEQDLFEKLGQKELHLVVGGFTDKNTWKSKISFTRPYFEQDKKKYVMAVLKGENAFTVALEKFLYQQEPQLKSQIRP